MKDYSLAKLAYDGYCSATGGVSLISGDKLPEFDSLKSSIQDAWFAASEAVRPGYPGRHEEAQLEQMLANADLMRAQAELARAQALAVTKTA